MKVTGSTSQGYPNQFCAFTDRWLRNAVKDVSVATTISVNTTLPAANPLAQYYAGQFTVNAGISLVAGPAGNALIVCAKNIIINGSITASGLSSGATSYGAVVDAFSPRSLFNAGTGTGLNQQGEDYVMTNDSIVGAFSAFAFGGGTVNTPNTLKGMLSKYSLLCPQDFIAWRKGGNGGAGGPGGTAIFLIAESITLGAAASLLCNGTNSGGNGAYGGPGGVIGLFANDINIAAGASIQAKGGDSAIAGSNSNFAGGGGLVWIVGRKSLTNAGTVSVTGGVASNSTASNVNGEAGSTVITQYDWLA